MVKVKGNWKRVTNIKITAFDLEGNIIDIQEFQNLITNDGLNMMRDGLYGPGGAQDLELKVLAVGDDDGSVLALAVTNSDLGNETFRKARTSQSRVPTGSTTYIQYLDPTEANFVDIGNIEEIGWFAGDAADAGTPGSGIMISRVLYFRAKTSLESLQIERTDTFEEV